MSVWLCIPSARPPEQVEPVLAKWRERGYKIALWRDAYEDVPNCNYVRFSTENPATGALTYPGYAVAVDVLAHDVLRDDPSCDWIVTGGDDTLPDPNHTADEIAAQCTAHFRRYHYGIESHHAAEVGGLATLGVMQPTGDRFAGGCIDRIAGSPWIGREWCLRANQGKGPFWPEFTHMFGDEALKRTAEKLGAYWARRDLTHFHNHFMRKSDAIDSAAVRKKIPPHLVQWNTPEHWEEMKAIFKRLEAEDFKPCLPL
jgi:hypothetical protein